MFLFQPIETLKKKQERFANATFQEFFVTENEAKGGGEHGVFKWGAGWGHVFEWGGAELVERCFFGFSLNHC